MDFNADTIYNEKEKIWYGPKDKAPLFHPDYSIGQVLYTMMKLKPKSIALESDSEGTSCTYEELLTDSIRIAQHLEKFDFSQDDIVGMLADHTMYSTHIILACWFNGLCVQPIDTVHEQEVVTHFCGITRPKIIFCQGKHYNKVNTTCAALKLNALIYTMDDHIEDVASLMDFLQPTGTEELYVPKELEKGGDQTIFITNSSGSTGLPKAVSISNHSVLGFFKFKESDVVYHFNQLDCLINIMYFVNTIFVGAKRVISTKPPTAEYHLYLIEKYKITNMMAVPFIVAQILNIDSVNQVDFSSLRRFHIAGSMVSAALHKNICKLLKDDDDKKPNIVRIGYGSTEIGTGCTANFNVSKLGSVGKIRENFKIKLIDENGEQVGTGGTGEILVHKNTTWNGYFNNPKESSVARDTEGWYHTGDLGYFDEDGYLYIKDRIKLILKYKCYHYSPQEIEQVITNLPDVVEVCVFGNANETEGDRATAAIVKRKGSTLTKDEVIQYVAHKFEVEWKRLHGGVFFFDSLPKTRNGKLNRRAIRDMALDFQSKGNTNN